MRRLIGRRDSWPVMVAQPCGLDLLLPGVTVGTWRQLDLLRCARLEPWETGRDSLLWAIHELDRVDKHRLLLSVAGALTGIGLDSDSYELMVTKSSLAGTPPNR